VAYNKKTSVPVPAGLCVAVQRLQCQRQKLRGGPTATLGNPSEGAIRHPNASAGTGTRFRSVYGAEQWGLAAI